MHVECSYSLFICGRVIRLFIYFVVIMFHSLAVGNLQTSICQVITLIGIILAPSAGSACLSSCRYFVSIVLSVLLLNNVFTFFPFNSEPLWTLLYIYTINFSSMSPLWFWESFPLVFNRALFGMLCRMSAWMGGGVGRSCFKAHCGYAGPWINETLAPVTSFSVHFGRRIQTIA